MTISIEHKNWLLSPSVGVGNSCKKLLRRGFSAKELEGAQVGFMKPLQENLVGFEFGKKDVTQVEIYKGKYGLSSRVYFSPRDGFVPTYVITTKDGLQALRRTESKLLADPVLEGEVVKGSYGDVNLKKLASTRRVRKLLNVLLQQDELVYAERMTTHVYTGRDRHMWIGWKRANIRMFADRVTPDSGKYTALVFRRNGKPLMQKGDGEIGALNVTNDIDRVVASRPKMKWSRI